MGRSVIAHRPRQIGPTTSLTLPLPFPYLFWAFPLLFLDLPPPPVLGIQTVLGKAAVVSAVFEGKTVASVRYGASARPDKLCQIVNTAVTTPTSSPCIATARTPLPVPRVVAIACMARLL